jgi:uncharacterized protein YbaP (TraB family)
MPGKLWLTLMVLSGVVFAPLHNAQAAERPLFWKVSSGAGTTGWLFGSIHFGQQDMYPLPASVEQAFASADALVVEANILSPDTGQAVEAVATQGMYTGNRTLKDSLAPRTWQLLEQTVTHYGVPVEVFQRQKPWLVAITLTTLELNRQGLKEEYGIDRYFLSHAGARRIVELESISEQLGLFQDMSDQEQEQFLYATLQDLQRGEEYFHSVVRAWRQGDAGAIDNLLNESFRSSSGGEALYARLLSDRNVKMAHKIDDLMAQGGRYFVVVGAGHMVGDDGIVALLKQKGYTVTRQ